MSTDPRHQARILAEHSLPRSIRERLVLLDVDLQPILEALEPTVRPAVVDALLCVLGREHLTAAQREALGGPLLGYLTAVLADAPPGPRLRAVAEGA